MHGEINEGSQPADAQPKDEGKSRLVYEYFFLLI